jgi:PRTRC genetic system ThiF family protein
VSRVAKRTLDLSYVEAVPVTSFQTRRIHLAIVGLGGTGGFLARSAACIAADLRAQGKDVTLTFIDPDKVEEGNIPRQNFCDAEIRRYKAETLASRCSIVARTEIECICEPFEPAMVADNAETLTVIVGCVDGAAGRVAMGETLKRNQRYLDMNQLPRSWYLDLGNGLDFGQALFGSIDAVEPLARAFSLAVLGGCGLLPSPLLQQPKLREPRPEELEPRTLSCAQLLAANAQSMGINPMMAVLGAGFLEEFLLKGSLRRFATTVDLPSGTMHSRYTTRAMLAQAVGKKPAFFT